MRWHCYGFTQLSVVLFTISCFAFSCTSRGQTVTVVVQPDHSHIGFTAADNLHTVHGSFLIKEGKFILEPATHKISGSITVDVRSGNSGNHIRDQKMHKEILESDRYPFSIFMADSLEGNITEGESHIKVLGQLNLHGARHRIALDVLVHRESNEISAKTNFVIPFVEWGMKDPSNFLFRLQKTVQMDIEIAGSVQP